MTEAEVNIRKQLNKLFKRKQELLQDFNEATGYDVDRVTYNLCLVETIEVALLKELEVIKVAEQSKRVQGQRGNELETRPRGKEEITGIDNRQGQAYYVGHS